MTNQTRIAKRRHFLINKHYKTTDFKNKYNQTLFLILTEYYKDYFNNGSNLPITTEVTELNNTYLKSSDEILNWFEDHYKKTNNIKNNIKLKTIYNLINNYKHFIEQLESNIFSKKI